MGASVPTIPIRCTYHLLSSPPLPRPHFPTPPRDNPSQPSTFSHLYQTGGHATPFSVIFPPNYHSSQLLPPSLQFLLCRLSIRSREREKCLDIVFHRGDRDNVYRSGFYVEFIYLFFLSSCFASRDAKQIDRRGNLRTVPKISPRNSSLDESIFRISEGCSRWKYRRTDFFFSFFVSEKFDKIRM